MTGVCVRDNFSTEILLSKHELVSWNPNEKRVQVETAVSTAHLKLNNLEKSLSEMSEMIVAFSGGVDSTFLLWVANKVLGNRVLAVTGKSESVASGQIEEAIQFAKDIGARHIVINTEELQDPQYANNPINRCYFCKKELFTKLELFAKDNGIKLIIEGSNLDDMSDYRPGIKAILEHGVRSPLKEVGLTKNEIRELSKIAGLPTWDKPGSPCLSSRIPYGMSVSIEKLSMIDRSEAYLRSLGFKEFRVRHHGEVARIELLPKDFPKLLEEDTVAKITKTFKEYGFQFVSLDLQGFRSGSLNEGIIK